MRKRHGFTLIELMIVVAIIAILAALAMPAYQDYVLRSRIAEGMSLVADAKTSVVENASAGRPFGLGFTLPAATKSVSSIAIDPASGLITVVMKANAGNGTVQFAPQPPLVPGIPPGDRVDWTCTGGTLEQRYRPSTCRN